MTKRDRCFSKKHQHLPKKHQHLSKKHPDATKCDRHATNQPCLITLADLRVPEKSHKCHRSKELLTELLPAPPDREQNIYANHPDRFFSARPGLANFPQDTKALNG